MGMVSKILQDSGFRLNRGKTRYGSREISLSGFVVSQNIHLSRAKLHPLNQLLHFLGETEVYGTQPYCVRRALLREPNWLAQVNGLRLPDGRGRWKAFRGTEDFLNYLCGYRALLLSVLQANPPEDSGMKQLERKLRKIEMVVDAVLKAD